VRGHHVAELDPLGILDTDLQDVQPPELELSHYGFTERDLDKQITLGPGILPHFATEDRKTMSLGEIIKTLKRIYCKFLLLVLIPHVTRHQVVLSGFNMSTSRTKSSATGFVRG
jgi:2-oxoglutarate dehydrogenase complex dehydrogenase (E1) component-like enzyme